MAKLKEAQHIFLRKSLWMVCVPFDIFQKMVLFSLLLVDYLGLTGRKLHAMTYKIRRKDVSVAFQLACSLCFFQKLSRCPEVGNMSVQINVEGTAL